ncbi:MAG TPA: hypothetical protein VFY16_02230 [Gemmatimonadaceae bacterium]|nr:hypothetical protein [Gemmatimonadaceae bacterium]
MSVSAVFDFDPSEHYRASRAVARLSPMRWVTRAFAVVSLGMVTCTVLPAWGGRVPLATLVWSVLPERAESPGGRAPIP